MPTAKRLRRMEVVAGGQMHDDPIDDAFVGDLQMELLMQGRQGASASHPCGLRYESLLNFRLPGRTFKPERLLRQLSGLH